MEVLARRICDLMTGQFNTTNSITFEGYIHSAAIMIKGFLQDRASQFIYLSSGRTHSVNKEQLLEVRNKYFWSNCELSFCLDFQKNDLYGI